MDAILIEAQRRAGIPYKLPPDGINTLDCSLYVLVTFQSAGVPFPPNVRTAEQIRQQCDPIDWAAVEPGDLLFFEHTYEPNEPPGPDGHVASHVGISEGAGSGRMWDCHESVEGGGLPGVGETNVSVDYWQERIFQAARPRQVAAQSETPGRESGAPNGSGAGGEASGGRFRATADGVRLRAQPSTSAPILVENLGGGAAVSAINDQVVDADGHRWRNVRAKDGQVGWVAEEFLQPVSEGGGGLPDDADHQFTFAELWPTIEAAAAKYGADPQVIAAIMDQESSFKNWRVHHDGTGHGLFGLDDNGLLPDFEVWSGLSCGRGQDAISIPPGLQIEFCAMKIAALARQFGSPINAARVWHRGPGLWDDSQGAFYEERIRSHVQELFA